MEALKKIQNFFIGKKTTEQKGESSEVNARTETLMKLEEDPLEKKEKKWDAIQKSIRCI